VIKVVPKLPLLLHVKRQLRSVPAVVLAVMLRNTSGLLVLPPLKLCLPVPKSLGVPSAMIVILGQIPPKVLFDTTSEVDEQGSGGERSTSIVEISDEV
jgi:hypothetical protein